MVTTEKVIATMQPAASRVLAADAEAVSAIGARKASFAGLDLQPIAAAVAMERRGIVATEMRKVIAPELGWTFIEDHFSSGAYEWLAPDEATIICLSKTTAESRAEAAKQLLGVQPELALALPAPSTGSPGEKILLRLMGSPLGTATIDVVAVGRKGVRGHSFSLRSLAEMETEQIPSAATPSKAKVTLPGGRRATELG